jgi:hypothetical protein
MDDVYPPTSQSYREWLQSRHEPPELKMIAVRAIEAFESITNDRESSEEPLDHLYCAASHSRFVVWEVGLPLLAQIAEQSEDARAKILDLARDRKSENRRRSIQYLSDRFPRKFCVAILAELLTDKSARVRGFSAGRCCGLALNELLPSISMARSIERDQTAQFELDFAFHLMRDNFYEYEDRNGYNIVLNFPEEYPASHVWPGQVTKDMVLTEGVAAIRSRVGAENVSLGILRRPWNWSAEQNAEPELPMTGF